MTSWLLRIVLIVFAGGLLYYLQIPPDKEADASFSFGSHGDDLSQDILSSGQLPQTVEPLEYHLKLKVDPRQKRFSGSVTILLNVKESSRIVWLHGRNLRVRKVVAHTAAGDAVAGSYREVDDTGLAQIRFPDVLNPGRATLIIDYEADFNQGLAGLYRTNDGPDYYAVTQFEATDARLAFPGFDDPRFKTPFSITLRVPKDMIAIANTAIAQERPIGDMEKLVIFQVTQPLPTYLLAMAVGPFDVRSVASAASNRLRSTSVPIQGMAPRGRGDELNLALQKTAPYLADLENYTGLPYAFDKIDLIAAPGFAASAMENAGAIIYRDSVLLLGPNSTLEQRRRLYDVHMHELAHQWFGNLVTPYGWDDIWLNESFATWLALKLLSTKEPALGFDREIQRGALQAMVTDSLSSPRRIREPIKSASDIDTAFDAIIYEKGAAIISMFEQYLGAEKFRLIVQRYLADHQGGHATGDDFLSAVTTVQKEETAATAIATFLDQSGIPYVTLDWRCPEAGGVTITATQIRYTPLGIDPNDRGAVWHVPLCFKVFDEEDGAASQCALLRRPTQTFYVRTKSCPAALMPNADGRGYYRWALTPDKRRNLLKYSAIMTPGESLSFADSISAGLHAGEVSLADYLEVVAVLAKSKDLDAAILPLTDFRFILDTLAEEDLATRDKLAATIAGFYQNHLDYNGGEPRTSEQSIFHKQLLKFFAFDLEDDLVRSKIAASRDPDLKELQVALSMPDNAQAIVRQFSQSSDRAEQERILRGMALGASLKTQETALGLLHSDQLRSDQVLIYFTALGRNRQLRDPLWLWLKDNLETLSARLPEWRRNEILDAALGFCTLEKRTDVASFFKQNLSYIGNADRRLDNTLEMIDRCIALRASLGPQIQATFGSASRINEIPEASQLQ